AEALQQKDFVGTILPVETNIIICEITGRLTAKAFAEKMKEQGILLIAISSTQIRMVLHLDITVDMVHKTIETIHQL
ncbi:hypothetical protein ABTJ55_19960, partial [Acinetobacter baumannii]